MNVQPKSPRLLSLDVFRGLTIAAMILVNDPGDWGHIYAPLEHSKWNGCTPTDLIFPFFLFMVGVSIVYAMETKKQIGESQSKMILQALRRTLILLAISWGTHLLFHPDLAHMRIPGVLPRIAVVYFICTMLYLKTSQKTRDWLFAILLIGYYLAMNFIPVAGCWLCQPGKGYQFRCLDRQAGVYNKPPVERFQNLGPGRAAGYLPCCRYRFIRYPAGIVVEKKRQGRQY